jgi:hypothetical protein
LVGAWQKSSAYLLISLPVGYVTKSTNYAITLILLELCKLNTHLNAYNSTILVKINKDRIRVYNIRGIYIGNSFIINTL